MSARFGTGGNCKDFYDAGNKSSVQIFNWLSGHGLDLYEYQAGRGIKCSAATACSIKEEAQKYSIALTIHAPYYISLSSENEEKRHNSVSYILQSLKFANSVGAKKIVVHAGGVGKLTRSEALELSKLTLSNAAAAAYENKLDGIKIGLETMGKENQLGTLVEIVELCKLDKIFIPVIDFGHLYARSIGKNLLHINDYMRVFEFIEKELGTHTVKNLHCHFSKIEYTKKGEKNHLKLSDDGFGPDYEQFIEAIVKADISPDVICETAGTMTADAKTMKDRYALLYSAN